MLDSWPLALGGRLHAVLLVAVYVCVWSVLTLVRLERLDSCERLETTPNGEVLFRAAESVLCKPRGRHCGEHAYYSTRTSESAKGGA